MRYLGDDDLTPTRPAETMPLAQGTERSNLRYGNVAKARAQ